MCFLMTNSIQLCNLDSIYVSPWLQRCMLSNHGYFILYNHGYWYALLTMVAVYYLIMATVIVYNHGYHNYM
jgi:hypothetical protein